ncbi:MAG: signal peptidase II [Bacilli bacterium]|nr:signal peptidase II [Bacilli bacterium]
MTTKFKKADVKAFLLRLIRHPLFYVLLALIAIDIASKWIVANHFNCHATSEQIWLIPNFICVTLSFNTGAIFGLGNGELWSRVFFIIVRLLITLIGPIIYFLKGQKLRTRYKVCLAMIYAGCIGNLIDGSLYWESTVGFNGVIDWIQFSFFPYIFNLADAYITIAVFLVIIFIIIDEVHEVRIKNRQGAYTLTPEEYEKKMAEENRKKNGMHDSK